METWRDITGWPYAVSDAGRVKRTIQPWKGRAKTTPLRPRLVTGNGYTTPYVRIVLQDGRLRRRCVFVHVLVLEAFKGLKPTPQHQCNHINGTKTDNRPENLEWVTPSENQRHAIAIGLKIPGPRNVKVPPSDVPLIRSRAAAGATTVQLAKEYGVHNSTIGLIVRRKTWAHIP